MTKEVEEIIKEKSFAELTSAEKAQVADFAQNEEEFASLKWFLAGTAATFAANKIEASPNLKKGVMEQLATSKSKKGFWLNSVGVFLLPAGKKTYQKPAFQIGIAAVAVIGLLFFINSNPFDAQMNSLAINEKNNEPVEENTIDTNDPYLNESLGNQQAIVEEDYKAVEEVAPVAPVLELSPGLAISELEEEEPVMDFEATSESDLDLVPASANGAGEPLVFDADVVALEDEVEAKDQYLEEEVEEIVKQDAVESRRDKLGGIFSKKREQSVIRNEASSNESDDVVEKIEDTNKEEVNGASVSSAEERIIPKNVAITKTKELNNLFHTEK